jgi:hypothetical protein
MISRYIKPLLCLLLILGTSVIQSQSLKIQEEKYIEFFTDLLIRLDDKNNISSSISEMDSEKMKQFGKDNFNKFSQSEKSVFRDFLNLYDEKRISNVNQKNDQQNELGKFYSSDDHIDLNILDSSEVYKEATPILKYFYKNGAHLISINTENFSLRVNPILHAEIGNSTNDTSSVFQNTRGLTLKGYIDNKLYFYSQVIENQQGFLNYIDEYINKYSAIPNNGFYKNYNSSVIGKLSGYDFLNAQGHIGIPISKSVNIELGHGRHMIGDGYRSLLLSNFSNNYFYMKFNTSVWKLNYQNIFAELNPYSANFVGGDELLGKKYMANHYLSFKANKNLEFGLFESVVFSRPNKFDFQYLNPVILYRTVEHLLGSADNALLGFNLNYTIKNKFKIYGQIMLDEFNLELLKKDDGSFVNKHGFQIGIKYPDFIIKQLHLFAEYNTVRPYTYSHNRPDTTSLSISNYSHYNQALAHPLGSNFREIIFGLNYNPTSRLNVNIVASNMSIGRDKNGLNYGSEILRNTNTLVNPTGNKTLQGERNDILFFRGKISYDLMKNYNLFINTQYRSSKSKDITINNNSLYFGGGLSINFNTDRNIF